MRKNQFRSNIFFGLSGLVLMSTTQAAAPVWTFSPVQGFPNTVTVSATGTATIKYTVMNQSHKAHTLEMKPIQGITPSGCTSALGYHQSCILSLVVRGGALTGDVTSGPVLCDQGNSLECYQPSRVNSLRIIRGEVTTLVVAGQYFDGSINRPLLALSQDSGVAWTFPESITAPIFTPNNTYQFINSGIFYSSSCSGSCCIAAGGYNNDTINTGRPLLVLSQDSGTTWSYPESLTAPSFNTYPFNNNGYFSSTSCSGSSCIASGSYSDNENPSKYRPLLAVSQDSGATWTYPESITTPSFTPIDTHSYSDFGYLLSASCSGSTCIASGFYSDSVVYRPLLALSQDSGANWIYPESINDPVFTPDNNTYPFSHAGSLNGASCSGSTCIASGSYADNTSPVATTRPLLALSQNSGATWTYPDSINKPSFNANPFKDLGNLNSASCNGSTCIATGSYMDTNNITRPLLALSQDSGATWTYPESITAPIFSPNNTYPFGSFGNLTSASCNSSLCIAVGSYTDNHNPSPVLRPLLALSQDSGATWTYPESITAPIFSPNNTNLFTLGYFDSVSCTGSICSAAGTYNDGIKDRPLLALSYDSGVNWTFPESLTMPVFTPNDTYQFINGGYFLGASSDSSLLPDSLRILKNEFSPKPKSSN